jgi:hypothetical protein
MQADALQGDLLDGRYRAAIPSGHAQCPPNPVPLPADLDPRRVRRRRTDAPRGRHRQGVGVVRVGRATRVPLCEVGLACSSHGVCSPVCDTIAIVQRSTVSMWNAAITVMERFAGRSATPPRSARRQGVEISTALISIASGICRMILNANKEIFRGVPQDYRSPFPSNDSYLSPKYHAIASAAGDEESGV